MAYIKVAKPYSKYLDALKRRIQAGGGNTIKLNSNGAARYLGRIARESDGAFSIARNSGGETFLIMHGNIRKL